MFLVKELVYFPPYEHWEILTGFLQSLCVCDALGNQAIKKN